MKCVVVVFMLIMSACSSNRAVRFSEIDPRFASAPSALQLAKLRVVGERNDESIQVALIGAFGAEGTYYLKRGASLADAVSVARGLAGSPVGFIVWRGGKGLSLKVGFHDRIERFSREVLPKVALQDGDVVTAIPPPPV